MKRGWIVWLCAAGMTLSGCGQGTVASMTESEQKVISEYAAYVLLRNSNNYQPKLLDYVEETTTMDSGISSEGIQETDSQGSGSNQTSGKKEKYSTDSLAKALGISEQFVITYTNYDVTDSYPPEDTNIFSMNANEGQKYVVLHFQIQNTGQEALCNVLSNDVKFRIRLNENNTIPSQLTMQLNDLYAYQETIAAGETKEAILIFQVPQEQTTEIETIELTVIQGETTRVYQLSAS